jgi:hypothetical protein
LYKNEKITQERQRGFMLLDIISPLAVGITIIGTFIAFIFLSWVGISFF